MEVPGRLSHVPACWPPGPAGWGSAGCWVSDRRPGPQQPGALAGEQHPVALISEGTGRSGSSQQGRDTQEACPAGPYLRAAGHQGRPPGDSWGIPNLHSQSLEASIWKTPGRPGLGYPGIPRIRDQVRLGEALSMPRAPQGGMATHVVSPGGQNSLPAKSSLGQCPTRLEAWAPYSHLPADFWGAVHMETHPQCVDRDRRSVSEARVP